MKKYLYSTLVAAAAMAVPAWATDYSPSGSGTQNDPYYATSVPTSSDRISISTSIFTGEGTTIYLAGDTEDKALGNSSINSFLNGSVTAYCDIVIGAAGVYLTNGTSSNIQTFYGAISGEGSWTSSNESSASVVIHYAFLGDLSKWNGNFTIYTTNTNDYVAFGGTITNNSNNTVASVTGQAAATNTSVSGNGAIAVDYGTVHYAYTNYATGTSPSALTVTNTYIEAHKIEFGGAVNYDVSSNLIGVDAGGATNSTLEISTSGNVTVTGSISGFDSVVVDTGSTLTLSGSVDLSSAISNSGTVVVTSGVVFELGNLTAEDGVYTIISSGGTITGWNSDTLTSANFTLDGWDLGRSTITISGTDGQATLTTVDAKSLTWAGTDGATWSNQGGDGAWGDNETFYNRDSVTFGTHGQVTSQTVNISGSLLAGTIMVNDNYTFVFEDGAYVEATYVDVTSASYTLKLQVANSGDTAEFHMDSEDFYQFFYGTENQGNIDIGTGVTFYLSDLTNSASFTSAGFSLTGTGTLSVGATGGIGLYLPDFQGTVEFRSGTVRFDSSTGIYNSSATLLFDAGVGIQLTGDFTTAVSAALVFEAGSYTISAYSNNTAHSGEFSGTISAADATLTLEGKGGSLTFSGSSMDVGTLILGSDGLTTKFSGNGTFVIDDLQSHTTGTVHLDLSGLTGSLTVNTLNFGAAGTIELVLGAGLYAIGEINFNYNGTVNFTNGTDGSAAVSIVDLTMGSSHSITFSGVTATITGDTTYGNVSVTGGATLDLTLAAQASNNSGNGSLTITGEGSTVTVSELKWGEGSNFGAAMYNNRIQISNGGILEVTEAQSSGTGGGERGFAVTSGEGTYKYSGTGESYIHSTERNIHVADDATLIFDVVNSGATLNVSMVIANGLGNDSDVLSSATTSTGSLVKTGAGTLKLSGENMYSGGTTIKEGVLVAANSSALGSGNVSVSDGAKLQLDVAMTTSGTVEFASGATLILGDDLLEQLATTNLDAVAEGAIAIITASDISFGGTSVSEANDDLINQYVSAGDYLLTWTWEDGTLYAAVAGILPEPSMFGLMFGLGAIGLVATRRRRR